MNITVAKDGSGDFDTVQAAIDAASPGDVISIRNGIYKERIELDKNDVVIEGEDPEKTVITEGYYALMLMEDGQKRGTFRSYTALINADGITVRNITIENSAGFGKDVGQAVAVYAEGDGLRFENCRILGHQDTLFTGPLPLKANKPGGFTGPTQDKERRVGRQYYESCYICGEVDFIFGSAAAYFYDCELYALDRGEEQINAYYTAPSTYEDQKFGYVFEKCRFTGNCPRGTAMLSRPWREHAKAVFIDCYMDENVSEEGFGRWNGQPADKTFYAEYNCHGAGYAPDKRAPFARTLTSEEACVYTRDNVLAPAE